MLNSLELDKCITDKERAVVLQEEITRREFELTQFKEMYQTVYDYVVNEWYNEFSARFPELVQQSFKDKDGMWVEVAVNGTHYNISIGKDKRKLFCLARITTKDYVDGRRITDDMARKLSDLLSWKGGGELMLEWFDANDFDAAFAHFCKIVGRFWELQKAEGVE